ncbi:O-antigen ligase family protein [Chitinophaga rhizophila]|uniref:O-antigen ligase family protein n=1 Tax=Chitinophaga rhizophila TaxID=2866212 RepID=A0ABS7G9H9_9BACT|nr:O-antigen ligase family protein [Chitinophaga rhizophila]MBW8683173.1 O-antigen ligase family protein [Chitinophaga rhizophila]
MILVITITSIMIPGKAQVRSQALTFTVWDLLMGLLTVFIFINIRQSSPAGLTFRDVASPLICMALYSVVRCFMPLAFSGPTRVVFAIVILLGGIEVLIGSAQASGMLKNSISLFKIAGSFGNSGIYAMFLLSVLPLALYVFLDQRQAKPVYGYSALAIAALLIYALLCHADSRIGWITMGVIIAGYVYAYRRIPVYVTAGFAVVGILLFIFLLGYKQDSTDGRSFVLLNSLQLAKQHFLWGVGVGNFEKYYNDFQAAYFSTHNDIAHERLAAFIIVAYNEFLQFLIEGGVIALLIMIAIAVKFFCFVRVVFRNEADHMLKFLVVAALSFVVTSMTTYPFRTMATLTHIVLVVALLGTADKQVLFRVNVLNMYVKGLSIATCLVITWQVAVLANSMFKWETYAGYISKKESAPSVVEVKTLYQKAFGQLSTSALFLHDYGEKLYFAKDYPGAIVLMEQAALRSSHYSIYESLGRAYEAAGNFAAAEKAFLKCSHLVPNRFYPKYSLMLLYLKQQQPENARKWANVITGMPVKVDGEDVRKIKQLAQRVTATGE